jgi:glycosyltransferase involved in cell wall biosynthesis
VPDVRPYYREALLSIVPLEIAGGSRLKILESFAAGVPVVSTPVGAEGLAVVDGEHLCLTPAGDPFARAIVTLASSSRLRLRLAHTARSVAAAHDWSRVGEALRTACDRIAVRPFIGASFSESRMLARRGSR